ncbi:hypothetical protein MINTMi27_15790 [Mycobacterium intracellulare]|uniref:ATP-dependent Clp protease proteolytic subunit n=1 Tax=Mycobacterium intracellulare TaxID=1767 RepID=UPI0019281DB7|nr:ATP-dependent Clp protease proteolytic subunit [Mycobacterium intracellulare]BCP41486.1 hypothetical protein MINTMi27_15790 [Mycobacterium intracellulare]
MSDTQKPEWLLRLEGAKYEAEAAKALAEADVAKAEAQLKLADVRRKTAEAQVAEYHAESSRVSRDATLRQEKISLASNHHHHVFEFLTGVYDEPVSSCLSQLAIWHRDDPTCDMNIIMDSPGGSVIDGMHLFDQILAYSTRPWDTNNAVPGVRGGHFTTMTVRGYAASMAGILLQSADHRVIGPESYLMIHEISSFTGGKIGEIKDEVKFLDKISERVVNLFVRRAGGKISKEEFEKLWERKDWWLTSEEALQYGFVDEIG